MAHTHEARRLALDEDTEGVPVPGENRGHDAQRGIVVNLLGPVPAFVLDRPCPLADGVWRSAAD